MPKRNPIECWVVVDACGNVVSHGPSQCEAWYSWYYVPGDRNTMDACHSERDRLLADGWTCVKVREVPDEA